MDEKRKQPIVFWIVGLLLLVLVLYPASIWPALWLNRSRPAREPILTAYIPVFWILRRLPKREQQLYCRYMMSAVGDRSLFISGPKVYFAE